jgi:hypothetical protein
VVVFLLCQFQSISAERNSLNQEIYELDVSWAIQSKELSNRFGDKQALYNSFIENCHVAAGHKARMSAKDGEDFRIKMNTAQPRSMRNYTKMGFLKIKAPAETFKLIKDFWEQNRHKNETEWHSINTYHNMWESPPDLVNIQLAEKGGGPDFDKCRMGVGSTNPGRLDRYAFESLFHLGHSHLR